MDSTAKVMLGADDPTLDRVVVDLKAGKDAWARTTVGERIAILADIKDRLLQVSEGWAETAARKKLIPEGSALVGEEWISGPNAVMAACNGLMETLSQMDGKAFLKHLKSRETVSGRTAVTVLPHSIWEHLLFSGIKAEVWMAEGVTKANLPQHTARAYDVPANQRTGKIALVLGAGNIAAISPLDALQKLFSEHQVVVLKMNPVNDYLTDYLTAALKPLERQGLVESGPDPKDRRSRILSLTDKGGQRLAEALVIWRHEHAALDRELAEGIGDAEDRPLRHGLDVLAKADRPEP